MIKIELQRDSKGQITAFSVTGHAGYAEAGADIVCAAISALTQAALNGLDGYLHRKIDYVCQDGNLEVELKEPPDALSEAVLVTMTMALADIAAQYPERICMKDSRR